MSSPSRPTSTPRVHVHARCDTGRPLASPRLFTRWLSRSSSARPPSPSPPPRGRSTASTSPTSHWTARRSSSHPRRRVSRRPARTRGRAPEPACISSSSTHQSTSTTRSSRDASTHPRRGERPSTEPDRPRPRSRPRPRPRPRPTREPRPNRSTPWPNVVERRRVWRTAPRWPPPPPRRDLGVARCAELHPVRIFDCDGRGTVTDLLRGISHVSVAVRRPEMRPAVVVVSVGAVATRRWTPPWTIWRRTRSSSSPREINAETRARGHRRRRRGRSPSRRRTRWTCGRRSPTGDGAWTRSRPARGSASPLPTVGATASGNPGNPGDGMTVPGDPGDGTRLAHGTSIAAPLAGGLGAVFCRGRRTRRRRRRGGRYSRRGRRGGCATPATRARGTGCSGRRGWRAPPRRFTRGGSNGRRRARVSCAWFWGGRGAAFGGRAEALEGCF